MGINDLSLCAVKFSIKSFRIPELYVEVPETATIDSLKVLLDGFSFILFNNYFCH